MATTFDYWEKDPFFPAAEEVQESADRMESLYRIWVHERGGGDSKVSAVDAEFTNGELRRELHTALGTAKWQLDEFQRAIRSNDEVVSAGKDTRARHGDFVAAIGYRILEVENNFNEAEGRGALNWIHLDEAERDDLAAFLSASTTPQQRDKVVTIPSAGDIEVGSNKARVKTHISVDSSNDSSGSAALSSATTKEDTRLGHGRSASADADIGSWAIPFQNERNVTAEKSSNVPHKAPSSNLVKTSSLTSAFKYKAGIKYKNGAVKWPGADNRDVVVAIPLRSSQSEQGLAGYFERNKSCLNIYDEGTYNKKLYGWLGAVQRQLQRSQYQVRYRHPGQLIVFALAVLIIFAYVFRTIW